LAACESRWSIRCSTETAIGKLSVYVTGTQKSFRTSRAPWRSQTRVHICDVSRETVPQRTCCQRSSNARSIVKKNRCLNRWINVGASRDCPLEKSFLILRSWMRYTRAVRSFLRVTKNHLPRRIRICKARSVFVNASSSANRYRA